MCLRSLSMFVYMGVFVYMNVCVCVHLHFLLVLLIIPQIIITELCDFKVQLKEHVLHLTSHTKDIQCIQNIKVQTCNLETKTSHIIKRWLPRSDVKSSHSKCEFSCEYYTICLY